MLNAFFEYCGAVGDTPERRQIFLRAPRILRSDVYEAALGVRFLCTLNSRYVHVCGYLVYAFGDSYVLARRQVLTVMSARGATCARSQMRRNCASPCAVRRAPKVQRVTAVGLLERLSARQTWQLCGAAAIAPRAPARAQNRRCTRAAGATPQMSRVTLAQIRVTETGTEMRSIFWGHPVMRKVGESLSMRTLTPLWLCAARARVARAPFAARRAC